jgi:D-alanine-D-alanine ligase
LAAGAWVAADFRGTDRISKGERLLLLKASTQPGKTETSDAPELASFCGQTVDELVQWMVQDASPDRDQGR